MVILDTVESAVIAAIAVIVAAIVGAGSAYVTRRVFPREAVLQVAEARFAARLRAYTVLLPLLDFGPEWAPTPLTTQEREARLEEIRSWYYDETYGGGLLLGGDAHAAWVALQHELRKPTPHAKEIRRSASRLRTELRIDLHIRHPGERDKPLPSSEEHSRWR